MLSEKLDQLIRISGATNGEIAYLSGFDRTNISHFRSGKRVPKREGAAFRSLVFGILLYYDQNGKNAELRKLIGAEEDAGPEEMRMLLSAWLFEGMSEGEDNIYSGRKSAGSAKRTRTVQAPSFFPERLHLSLGIAELSNVRFSHQLHTDPSLISRWNKGIRSPQNNPQLCERISTILLEQIRKLGRTEILAELMEISEPEVCQETFAAWLFQTKDPEDQNLRYAEDLLAAFENVAGKKILEAEEEENMSQILLPEKETPVYIGTDGLRTAVLRFLKEAIRTQTKELFLYSDERQDWLMKDSEFKNKWALLMRECVRNGTKICIIHNIDRDLEEMNQAIASWLPLYLSGRIESWYMKKKDQSRFSHTIFLNPENSVIASFHVKGDNEQCLYHYYTEKEYLDAFQSQYQTMLTYCSQLFHMERDEGQDEKEQDSSNILEVPLPVDPFSNVRLRIEKNTVRIGHEAFPGLSFCFMHPLMSQAFRAYAEALTDS